MWFEKVFPVIWEKNLNFPLFLQSNGSLPPNCDQITWISLCAILYFRVPGRAVKERGNGFVILYWLMFSFLTRGQSLRKPVPASRILSSSLTLCFVSAVLRFSARMSVIQIFHTHKTHTQTCPAHQPKPQIMPFTAFKVFFENRRPCVTHSPACARIHREHEALMTCWMGTSEENCLHCLVFYYFFPQWSRFGFSFFFFFKFFFFKGSVYPNYKKNPHCPHFSNGAELWWLLRVGKFPLRFYQRKSQLLNRNRKSTTTDLTENFFFEKSSTLKKKKESPKTYLCNFVFVFLFFL